MPKTLAGQPSRRTVSVHIADERLAVIDAEARRLGLSRSELIRRALDERFDARQGRPGG